MDPILPPERTVGLLDDKTTTKQSGGGKKHTRGKKVKRLQRSLASSAGLQPTQGFNLAGRPNYLKDAIVKRAFRESTGLFDSTTANEMYWQFRVTTNSSEWVRFFPDSVTVQVFGQYNNPARDAASANAQTAAVKHSLRARDALPFMFLDPSVMGTSFVRDVEVIINGVRVPTNVYNNHLIQYARMCSIFSNKPRPHFRTTADLNQVNRDQTPHNMRQAMLAFDHETWNATIGSRIPVYLDGKFPFDFKNRTLETIDRQAEPTLYFPPESDIFIRVHLYKDKIEGIFHDHCNTHAGYFDANNKERPTGDLAITFQSVLLEYEKSILYESEHIKAMEQFAKGALAQYQYDIPRSQFQTILGGQSFTENIFQIPPLCRLLYILFLPSHATYVMEQTHKPLSGWSRFPANCTRLQLNFANEGNLITESFERFGDYDEAHQLSKKTYYDYLRERDILQASFDHLFPRQPGVYSLIQTFVVDTKNRMSQKTEMLKVQMEFTNEVSPNQRNILIMSVHPTGFATCRHRGAKEGWEWNFVST